MKTAIITGITGQDGSYLAKFLLAKNYNVIGLTRNHKTVNVNKLKYLGIENQVVIDVCDLIDISSVIHVFNKFKPDEVYNLAAQSSVGQSFLQPIGTIHFNIISVLNILETIRLVKPDTKMYQASSSEMFGKVKNLPVTLSTPMHPLSPYAISKSSGYWTVVNYRESYNLQACNGILFNHESFLRSNDFFVKKVISEAVANRNNSNWFLSVGNIEVKRDFGYSPKYVEAMWLMLQQKQMKDYIICSGKSTSLRQIVEYIFSKLSISTEKIKIDPLLFRPTDIEDIFGDNSLAKCELQWEYDLDFTSVLDILIEEEIKNITK